MGRRCGVGVLFGLVRGVEDVELAQELPAVVLSRLTGLEISSAIAWSNAIGASDSACATAAIERVGVSLPTMRL